MAAASVNETGQARAGSRDTIAEPQGKTMAARLPVTISELIHMVNLRSGVPFRHRYDP
jgi:hypothetical protein